MNRFGAVLGFLLDFGGILSVIGVILRVVRVWSWILAAMDVSDWLALRAEDRKMKD